MGSLFAGIGGFDLGFERAGFKTSWQVEIDPYCQKVLAKNFPEAERFGDIRECGSHNLKPVDVISGGFPCQDISTAGRGAGIEGERSGLWGDMCRIVCEIRPSFVLVENVAALLGRGMGRVLGDLAEIGYDAEWEIISAADVGAPHLRERVWITAYPNTELCGRNDGGRNTESSEFRDKSLCFAEGLDSDVAYTEGEQWERGWDTRSGRFGLANGSSEMAHSHSHNAQRIFAGGIDEKEWQEQGERSTRPCHAVSGGQWAVEPNVGRVAHGIPKRVDRLRGLGNAVVPQIPEMIARRIKQALEVA
jgi:DNA (cytosine-5)-methyltransferase 1